MAPPRGPSPSGLKEGRFDRFWTGEAAFGGLARPKLPAKSGVRSVTKEAPPHLRSPASGDAWADAVAMSQPLRGSPDRFVMF